jgi:hypothetical protein
MTTPSGKSAETAHSSRTWLRRLRGYSWLGALVAVLAMAQVVSQRIADNLLWAQERELRLEFTQAPCLEAGGLMRSSRPLPPSAGALLRSCFGGLPKNISSHAQIRALKLLVPKDISDALQPPETYPEEQIAVALYPSLAEVVRERCGKLQQVSPDLCRPERQLMVRDAVGDHLVSMIRSDDDLSLLRGLSLACGLGREAIGLAERVGEAPRAGIAVRFLRDCGLPREEAISELQSHIAPDDPLLGVAALELRRLEAAQVSDALAAVLPSLPPGLTKVLVEYALQGLADLR